MVFLGGSSSCGVFLLTFASSDVPLTDSQERNFFVAFVPGDSLSSRVEHRFAIHQEKIMMMAVAQRNLRVPATVGLTLHRVGGGVPIVKTADDVNGFGLRGDAQKIGRQCEFLG